MVKQLAENAVKMFRISLLPNSVDFVIKAIPRSAFVGELRQNGVNSSPWRYWISATYLRTQAVLYYSFKVGLYAEVIYADAANGRDSFATLSRFRDSVSLEVGSTDMLMTY